MCISCIFFFSCLILLWNYPFKIITDKVLIYPYKRSLIGTETNIKVAIYNVDWRQFNFALGEARWSKITRIALIILHTVLLYSNPNTLLNNYLLELKITRDKNLNIFFNDEKKRKRIAWWPVTNRSVKSVPDARYQGIKYRKKEIEREEYGDQRKTWIMSGDSTVRT